MHALNNIIKLNSDLYVQRAERLTMKMVYTWYHFDKWLTYLQVLICI